MSEPIIQIAETIQTASINRHPDPAHDVNPSTAASAKVPVQFDDDVLSDAEDVDDDEIPESVLRPIPRRSNLPPLPDLRFEQSYLASIQNADSWQRVAVITIKDQVLMPLVQGMVWTLLVSGWRHFNRATKFSGQSIGARIRRWWWETNNWKLPTRARLSDPKLAEEVKEMLTFNQYYTAEFGSAAGD